MSFGNLTQPPVGTGGYTQWFVFVLVIILSLVIAEMVVHSIGLKGVK